jgi:hypothetical protein
MDKGDIMYTLSVYNKDINKIESAIKEMFNVKFIAFDQYELKVSFTSELTDKEEIRLFNILEINKN